jgi:hypothetical protein
MLRFPNRIAIDGQAGEGKPPIIHRAALKTVGKIDARP